MSGSPQSVPVSPASGAIAPPVVEVRDLVKDYTDFLGRPKLRALGGVSFEIRAGEVFGLLGPNGSGKTTTLKILLGLLFPTSGEVKVLGAGPRDVAAKRRIGFLPEESYLYRFLTAAETLDFYAKLFGLPRAERRARTAELLERVGLTHAAGRKLGTFSKGMARRIGLAQALINDPDLLILDEPTSGLDPLGTREVKDLIAEQKAAGKTVLLSSHLLADVEDVCDRIAILHRGRRLEYGQVEELLTRRDVTQFRVHGLEEADIEAVAAYARARAGEVTVDHPRERLEALFLRVVREAEKQKVLSPE